MQICCAEAAEVMQVHQKQFCIHAIGRALLFGLKIEAQRKEWLVSSWMSQRHKITLCVHYVQCRVISDKEGTLVVLSE